MELVDVIYNFDMLKYYECLKTSTPKEKLVLDTEMSSLLQSGSMYQSMKAFIDNTDISAHEKGMLFLSLYTMLPDDYVYPFNYKVTSHLNTFLNESSITFKQLLELVPKEQFKKLPPTFLIYMFSSYHKLTDEWFDILSESILLQCEKEPLRDAIRIVENNYPVEWLFFKKELESTYYLDFLKGFDTYLKNKKFRITLYVDVTDIDITLKDVKTLKKLSRFKNMKTNFEVYLYDYECSNNIVYIEMRTETFLNDPKS